MRLDNPPTDRQAHAGALRFGGEERLEKRSTSPTGLVVVWGGQFRARVKVVQIPKCQKNGRHSAMESKYRQL
jgi:hypothetical protein